MKKILLFSIGVCIAGYVWCQSTIISPSGTTTVNPGASTTLSGLMPPIINVDAVQTWNAVSDGALLTQAQVSNSVVGLWLGTNSFQGSGTPLTNQQKFPILYGSTNIGFSPNVVLNVRGTMMDLSKTAYGSYTVLGNGPNSNSCCVLVFTNANLINSFMCEFYWKTTYHGVSATAFDIFTLSTVNGLQLPSVPIYDGSGNATNTAGFIGPELSGGGGATIRAVSLTNGFPYTSNVVYDIKLLYSSNTNKTGIFTMLVYSTDVNHSLIVNTTTTNSLGVTNGFTLARIFFAGTTSGETNAPGTNYFSPFWFKWGMKGNVPLLSDARKDRLTLEYEFELTPEQLAAEKRYWDHWEDRRICEARLREFRFK